MVKRAVSFSDLSGQMAEEGGLIPLVITNHPDLDERVRIEVTADEMEKIGKLAIAAVGLETESTNDERPTRYVVPLGKFASLATVAPIEQVLANAEPVTAPKPQRRSHNTTKDGEPLINYNDPEYAGLPHKGKIGEQEADFVQNNLEVVNERRVGAGHSPIDPANPVDAKRYGFSLPE